MRMIILLVSLAIVGLLIAKQLGPQSASTPDSASGSGADAADSNTAVAPKVSNNPQDLKTFSKDMNVYMQQTAADRAEELKKIESDASQ